VAEVRLVGVAKRFGDFTAVDHINVRVPEGSFITFLGPSGCGKTTTLRMVAGLETPTEGEIFIGDDCVFGKGSFVPPERREIGMVFQSYAVWPHLTAFENVAFPLRIRRLPKSEIRERTMEALELVRLGSWSARLPSELSGGQQQRIALARAIVFRPRLLLLDEPLSNLDAKLREYMRLEIRELHQRLGVTTLYVTHDQHEALALSDIVVVMEGGRIVQSDAPRAIYDRPASRFVADFVGWANVLPAEVIDAGSVKLAGRALKCAVPPKAGAGSRVFVCMRPEDVVVRNSPPDGGANVLRARVKTTLYAGTYTTCELTVGDVTFLAYVPVHADIRPNAEVSLFLDPSRIRILTE
jgi:iron(III) transport system ATP-binding protein